MQAIRMITKLYYIYFVTVINIYILFIFHLFEPIRQLFAHFGETCYILNGDKFSVYFCFIILS